MEKKKQLSKILGGGEVRKLKEQELNSCRKHILSTVSNVLKSIILIKVWKAVQILLSGNGCDPEDHGGYSRTARSVAWCGNI